MKQKILHIQLLPLLSGVQNVMLNILQGLEPSEFDVYVASKPDGPLVDEVKRRGYHYIPLPFFVHKISLLDVVILFQLFFICRKHRFDIVHTHSSKPGLLGRIAARLAGVPLVLHTGHGSPIHENQSLPVKKFYMVLEKLGALFCNRMIFVNNYHRKFYVEHNLINEAKAVTIFNALNPELQNDIERKTSHRKLVGEKAIIGSILRFSKQKNLVMTVAAAISVCLVRQDVIFIFAGDGEVYDLCKRMVDTNCLQERIQLPGWRDDTAAQLSRFDVFMLYSNCEGLPLSIIEAMFAGLPVLASDIPANAELVGEENGWLVPAEKKQALEDTLNKIIDARDSYVQKGMRGKMKAKELCSYENFIREYLKIYRGGK
jgi:glycosyltransferase involved in cell wall biosynthesis